MPRRRALLLAVAGCATLPTPEARAWTPAAPVRVPIGFPPGGAVDVLARILADGVRGAGGVTLVPGVRSGACGLLALKAAARAPADGLTLASAIMGMLCVLPEIPGVPVPLDLERDVAPVRALAGTPMALVARPDAPFADLDGLVAYVRRANGAASYASSGNGNDHVAGAHLAQELGAPATLDVAAGRVDLMVANVAEVAPMIRAGQLRGIAVTAAAPSPMLPELPPLALRGGPADPAAQAHAPRRGGRDPAGDAAPERADTRADLGRPLGAGGRVGSHEVAPARPDGACRAGRLRRPVARVAEPLRDGHARRHPRLDGRHPPRRAADRRADGPARRHPHGADHRRRRHRGGLRRHRRASGPGHQLRALLHLRDDAVRGEGLHLPNLPNNEGAWRPVAVSAPPGCIVNPVFPASGGSRMLIGHHLPMLASGCLGQVVPERVMAACGSPMCGMNQSGLRADGKPCANMFLFNGGHGDPDARDPAAAAADRAAGYVAEDGR